VSLIAGFPWTVAIKNSAGYRHHSRKSAFIGLPRTVQRVYHTEKGCHHHQGISMRTTLALAALVLIVSFVAVSAQAEERYYDFGSATDFNDQNDIYFPKPEVNYWFWGITKPEKFVQYETNENFWWVTAPRNKSDAISARVLKSYHFGIFRAREITWGKTLHLAIRYKDNLLAPVSLWTQTGGKRFQIGQLGGAFDHKWKTALMSFPRKTPAAKKGWFEFQISRSDFGDLVGDLAVDWIRLSNEKFLDTPEKPGFWPTPPPTKFGDIGRTMVYQKGEKPRFIVGPMVKGMRESSWKNFAKAGCNHVNLQSWEMNWKRGWQVYSDRNFNDRVRYGFPDWNEACAEAGISCSVQFFTDTRSYWIENTYGKESEMLRVMEDVVKLNAKTKSNLLWYPIDEPDHDDATWGAPVEFAMQITDRIRRADPDSPILLLFQAWKPRIYEYYRDAFDIAAFDVYPVGNDRPVTEIAKRIDEMRRQLGDTKALWACIEGQDGREKRKLTKEEIVVQGYISIAHGIHGVIFFLDYTGNFLDMSYIPQAWAGIQQFATEITSPKNGIESFLVPPSEVVDIMGSSGRVKAPDDLHFTLRKRQDGKYALIVVNASRGAVKKAKITVEGLPALRNIEVRFENRLISSLPNQFIDAFKPYERHVYVFSMR